MSCHLIFEEYLYCSDHNSYNTATAFSSIAGLVESKGSGVKQLQAITSAATPATTTAYHLLTSHSILDVIEGSFQITAMKTNYYNNIYSKWRDQTQQHNSNIIL